MKTGWVFLRYNDLPDNICELFRDIICLMKTKLPKTALNRLKVHELTFHKAVMPYRKASV